jgi:predicted ATPase
MSRRSSRKGLPNDGRGFVRSVRLDREAVPSFEHYPFSIPAIRDLEQLDLDPKVTFLVGENGTGKSTLIEAIAVAAGLNAEGGTKNFAFATRRSESDLSRHLRLARSPRRPRDGYFLRAESYFNVATDIERMDADEDASSLGAPPVIDSYGGRSLHEQSHGEAFLALVRHRFGGDGFYVLDEPEAALSPNRQLALLALMYDLIERRASQFVIATHSSILMAYPGAAILHLSANGGMQRVAYEDTDHYRITKDFLANRERYFKHLFAATAPPSDDEAT